MATIIDAYTHNVPITYLRQILDTPDPASQEAARSTMSRCNVQPNLIDYETRIAQMDKYGINRQVSCIFQGVDPNHLSVGAGVEQIRLCKNINDSMADQMEKSKHRIISLGTPPLKGLQDGGIEEMRRAIKDLGLKGFMVVTNIGGTPVDRFSAFWDEVNRLGVPVYLHPVDPINSVSRPYEDEYDLMHVLGWPFETSLTMARLVLSGIMSKYANLKVVAHHLGAMIPFFAGRINESYDKEMSLVKPEQKFDEVKGKGRAIEHFRQFFLDTAIGGNEAAIKCALEIFGAEKIIFGTDYPFGPRNGISRLESYPGLIGKMDISNDEKRLIFEENASRLLKI